MPDLKINKDEYQIFLFTCPTTFPLMFARHPWFVINRKGTISRWEIFWRPKKEWETHWGHIHKNFYTLAQGIPIFFFSEKYVWKQVKPVGYLEGGENSIAQHMAEFIENSYKNYPERQRYSFFGPNSNSYAQWVLDKFPEAGLRLPWNCFGKNYKITEIKN